MNTVKIPTKPWLLALMLVCGAGVDAAEYNQAPMLAALVEAGKLPPVAERLPEEPLVIEPLHEIGKYGGTWRRIAITPDDSLLGTRLGYEPLVRWDRSGLKPMPGLAKSWKIEDGGKRYIFTLRKGLKWSDGHPFTTEDFLFFFNDIATSDEIGDKYLELAAKDTKMTVSAPDKLTVVFEFDKPHGIFLEKLCYRGHYIYKPKHYLQQFHLKYTDEAELEAKVEKAGFDHWAQLFKNRQNVHLNPDVPVVKPWTIKVGPPAMMYIVERNPFYWKVDTAGNQLPYIDQISYQVTDSIELANLIASTGELDMQGRHIEPSKYTLFMIPENRKRDGIIRYRVVGDPGPGSNRGINLNNSTQNPRLRPYITDRRFRIALSVAIDREEVIELITGGIGNPCNGVGYPLDRFFVEGMDQTHIQYDPALANRLLDEVGLLRGSDGMRRYPDGKRFREILYCVTAGTAGELDIEQLVVDYWREVGLEFVIKSEPTLISYFRGRNGDYDFIFLGLAGLHWVLHPAMYVPLKEICYSAPQYGRYIQTEGRKGVPPTPEFQKIIDNYHELIHTYGNPERQLELGRDILWQWSRECYFIGLHRDHALAIVSSRFRNFPDHILHGWRVMFPGYMQPEQFYLESKQHLIRAKAGHNGSVFPSGEIQVFHGNEQEFTFTPNDGYVVDDVNVNGDSVGAATNYRVDRVTGELNVSATFRMVLPD